MNADFLTPWGPGITAIMCRDATGRSVYCEIIAVCSQIPTKYINTLCGQNVKFVNVKRGCINSNQQVLEG